MNLKSILLWTFSFLFTLSIAYYQRKTGPTYPVDGKMVFADQTIKYKLIRSHGGTTDARLVIEDVDPDTEGLIKYKRLKTNDEWTSFTMTREGSDLVGFLPNQPPAGKLLYHIALVKGDNSILLNDEPTVIRFKGDVPAWALIPHVIFMFTAMMMSTRTGLEALFKRKRSYTFSWITTVTLLVGGLIFGPIVQKYAFGAFWTGWPFGQDLTDNKTLVAFVFWAIAVWRLWKNPANRTWPVVAMTVLLLVYLIPHSMFGSELDYGSGEVVTGR